MNAQESIGRINFAINMEQGLLGELCFYEYTLHGSFKKAVDNINYVRGIWGVERVNEKKVRRWFSRFYLGFHNTNVVREDDCLNVTLDDLRRLNHIFEQDAASFNNNVAIVKKVSYPVEAKPKISINAQPYNGQNSGSVRIVEPVHSKHEHYNGGPQFGVSHIQFEQSENPVQPCEPEYESANEGVQVENPVHIQNEHHNEGVQVENPGHTVYENHNDGALVVNIVPTYHEHHNEGVQVENPGHPVNEHHNEGVQVENPGHPVDEQHNDGTWVLNIVPTRYVLHNGNLQVVNPGYPEYEHHNEGVHVENHVHQEHEHQNESVQDENHSNEHAHELLHVDTPEDYHEDAESNLGDIPADVFGYHADSEFTNAETHSNFENDSDNDDRDDLQTTISENGYYADIEALDADAELDSSFGNHFYVNNLSALTDIYDSPKQD